MTYAYRVLKVTTNDFSSDPQPTTDVVWEGTDLDELSRRFPRSEVMGADELGYHQIEDGWVRWKHIFEQCSDGAEWQKINDPRRKVNDPRHKAFEAAIEAENRRLFPGDYIDDDDDYDHEEGDHY